MTRPLVALPALVLVLAGCDPVLVVGTPPPDDADACGAPGLESLLGEPAQAVTSMVLANPYRIIAPGQAVTDDYSPGRINFELDGNGRIARIFCG